MSTPASKDTWRSRAFFGIHYDLHAAPGDGQLGAELDSEMLRRQLEHIDVDWVQCDAKGGHGLTSFPTEVGRPAPGIVRDALRIHRDVTRAMGIPLVVHFMAIRDRLGFGEHPDWAQVDADGKPYDLEVCVHSEYAETMMIPQMLDIIDRYDVDGFWVDGDIWFNSLCWCDRCRGLFADETSTSVTETPTTPDDPRWAEWLAFHRRSYMEHVRRYVDAVHARKPDCLVCVNFVYLSLQPEPVDVAVDWLSGDMPHNFSTDLIMFQARVLDTRGMPWDLMPWGFTVPPNRSSPPWPPSFPVKPAAQLCQEASIILAAGGSVGFYLQPQRTGFLPTHQHDAIAEAARFCRARQAVSQDTRSVPQVAVLNSARHLYGARRGPTQRRNQTFGGGGVGPPNPVQGAVIALLDNQFHVDVLDDEALVARLEEYALVVIPEQTGLPEEMVARLDEYVRRGGRLLVTGSHVASTFGGILGVSEADAALPEVGVLATTNAVALVGGPWQAVRPVDARVLLPLLRDQELGKDETGWPAATINDVGEGRVAAIHGSVFTEYMGFHSGDLRRILRDVFDELDPPVALRVDGAGPSVHVTLRSKDGNTLVHLVNRGAGNEMSPRRPEVESVPDVGPLVVRLRRAHEPSSVHLVPEGAVEWTHQEGELHITVPRLGTHAAIVVSD